MKTSKACSTNVPQFDITPKVGVQVEYDIRRGVLYLSVDGVTVCRVNSIPGRVDFAVKPYHESQIPLYDQAVRTINGDDD